MRPKHAGLVLLAVLILPLLLLLLPSFSTQRQALGGVASNLFRARSSQIPIAKTFPLAVKAKYNVDVVVRASEYMHAIPTNTSGFRALAEIAAAADHECPRLNDVLDLLAVYYGETWQIVALAHRACEESDPSAEAQWWTEYDRYRARAKYASVEEALAHWRSPGD